MIALILGGAPSVWDNLRAAQALLSRPHIVVAANQAGIHFPGHLTAWCSLHPDFLLEWAARRAGNDDYSVFLPNTYPGWPHAQVVPDRWECSSGLYAAQVALFELKASGAILCGVPMDADAGHIAQAGPWSDAAHYRHSCRDALPDIGARTRSMGGWTQALYGAPTPEWVDAIDTAKPAAWP